MSAQDEFDHAPGRFNLGIRQKMLAVLLMVLVLSFTVTGYFVLQQQEKDILSETARRGHDISKFLSEAIALHVVSYDYHSIQIMLDELITSSDIVYAAVTSQKGNLMASSGDFSLANDARTSFAYDIHFDQKKVGLLQIALDNQDIVTRLEQKRDDLFLRELLTIIVIAIGEFVALSYFIARPVSVITNTIENSIDENGRITSDILIKSRDEFGRLATQFNRLRYHLNDAHHKLEQKIESADKRLIETNQTLLYQSDALKRMNAELEKLSLTDPLTGLYNRRYFERELENDIAISNRHGEVNSMIIMDIDHFKNINDTYGHHNGDLVLQKTAEMILGVIRNTDVLCRIGGEEFVMLCRRTGKEGATRIAEKLRSAIRKNVIMLGNEVVSVSISLGVTTLRPDGSEVHSDDFFRSADYALYYSKEHGRNRVTHYQDIVDKQQVQL